MKPREWPTHAMWARDGSAEVLKEAIHHLELVVCGDRPLTETEKIRREASALAKIHQALRILESVGAPKSHE